MCASAHLRAVNSVPPFAQVGLECRAHGHNILSLERGGKNSNDGIQVTEFNLELPTIEAGSHKAKTEELQRLSLLERSDSVVVTRIVDIVGAD